MTGLPIPDYDATAKCPKCAGDDIHTSYQRTAHCHSSSFPNECAINRFTPSDDCCDPAKSEHLHRYCRRCSYQWAENVVAS